MAPVFLKKNCRPVKLPVISPRYTRVVRMSCRIYIQTVIRPTLHICRFMPLLTILTAICIGHGLTGPNSRCLTRVSAFLVQVIRMLFIPVTVHLCALSGLSKEFSLPRRSICCVMSMQQLATITHC